MQGFTALLASHTTDQDTTGDLARLAAADPDWSEDPDKPETFTHHLESSGATRTTLQNLTDALVRYASR
ncbi:hypothetical protein [Streptomyces erythrochromogenes]|uniref:hypothetical protein n=1 Tax=Streptomyces erythrochromogenes TaxID=285574 RepID=UPI003677D2C7